MIRCIHDRPVADDGFGCTSCRGPAIVPPSDLTNVVTVIDDGPVDQRAAALRAAAASQPSQPAAARAAVTTEGEDSP